ncbi:PspC domain-containing protein [Shewanella sp. c952]|uniref:PspC domain-containing protein n=1 Tax=unclassified Shewanella TaxID=196818 RepID=UPI001BBF0AB1|nr:PspC domain-containing protein [Shewanella sp. c952]GIU07065.1 PspC domain-containing protein [Shewanella sp. c952]
MADLISRLKDPSSLVCGVAASMADKFEWSCLWTRIVCAVAVFCNPAMGLVIYFVLALLLPKWEKQC